MIFSFLNVVGGKTEVSRTAVVLGSKAPSGATQEPGRQLIRQFLSTEIEFL